MFRRAVLVVYETLRQAVPGRLRWAAIWALIGLGSGAAVGLLYGILLGMLQAQLGMILACMLYFARAGAIAGAITGVAANVFDGEDVPPGDDRDKHRPTVGSRRMDSEVSSSNRHNGSCASR